MIILRIILLFIFLTAGCSDQITPDRAAKLEARIAALEKAANEAKPGAKPDFATLRPVVDAFFDKVMVLDPDAAIRGAHLALIDSVLRGFSGIADFSEIVTA